MKKIIGYFVLVIILAALGWGIYSRLSAEQDSSGRKRGDRAVAVAVEIQDIKAAPVRDYSVFTGTLLPKSSLSVMPKVSARVEKIRFRMADHVKSGDVVAELDNKEFSLDVQQAAASLAAAQGLLLETNASLTSAREEFARTKALTDKKISPASEYDSALAFVNVQEARLASARSQIALRESALESANVKLSYAVVTAAWDNSSPDEVMTVSVRFVDEGTLIRANEPILTLLNIRVLDAVINVDERNYTRLVKNMPVKIIADALPGRNFSGTISRISPLLMENSRQANVEIEIANNEEILKPGMFVRAEIEFARHEGATVVPVGAIAKRDGVMGVFLVVAAPAETGGGPGARGDGKGATGNVVKFIPITIGITDGELVEILDPPLTGSVVTLGQHLLEDGSAIILPVKNEPQEKSGQGGRKGPNK